MFISAVQNGDVDPSSPVKQDLDGLESIEKAKTLTFEQVFLVYKFLETPLHTLIEGLTLRQEEEVRRYYRTIAK